MESILWILFTLICVIVSGVILLQEGKGGGLGEAFGGAGQQTFGVKAQGIAKFTGYMAGVLVVLALVISRMRAGETVFTTEVAAPVPVSDPTEAPTSTTTAPADTSGGEGEKAK
ncbi:MAG: preprotein translocase subunit SecG [Planctomycetota bacterium]|jgi:preprotein translocase subunit SecG|nr:preprotein translocase subunit SecG [Planctomycetota bacterium]